LCTSSVTQVYAQNSKGCEKMLIILGNMALTKKGLVRWLDKKPQIEELLPFGVTSTAGCLSNVWEHSPQPVS
jgi:hypothetical protein